MWVDSAAPSLLFSRNNGIVFVVAVVTVDNRFWRLSKGRWASPFGGGQVICTVRDSRRLARTVPAVHRQPRQRTRTWSPDRQFPRPSAAAVGYMQREAGIFLPGGGIVIPVQQSMIIAMAEEAEWKP